VLPGDLFDFIKEVLTLPGIRLEGIGSNVACLQGVHPTSSMLELLVELAYELRGRFKIALPIISGGNSSAWKLIEAGSIPAGINQVRFGEGIILGRETVNFDPISGAFQDAVLVEAELIEVKIKPTPEHPGVLRKRAILALGVQDICKGDLKPLDERAHILRRSSDHLVVDVTDSNLHYGVGDTMTFIPSYEAMLMAMTSPFVEKLFYT
jgi:predicted amino acid racemase